MDCFVLYITGLIRVEDFIPCSNFSVDYRLRLVSMPFASVDGRNWLLLTLLRGISSGEMFLLRIHHRLRSNCPNEVRILMKEPFNKNFIDYVATFYYHFIIILLLFYFF